MKKKVLGLFMATTVSVLSVFSVAGASSSTSYSITKTPGNTGNPSTYVSIATIKNVDKSYTLYVDSMSTSNNECVKLTGGSYTTVNGTVQRTSTGSKSFTAKSTTTTATFIIQVAHTGAIGALVYASGSVYMS